MLKIDESGVAIATAYTETPGLAAPGVGSWRGLLGRNARSTFVRPKGKVYQRSSLSDVATPAAFVPSPQQPRLRVLLAVRVHGLTDDTER